MFQNQNSLKIYIKLHILIYDALLNARSHRMLKLIL